MTSATRRGPCPSDDEPDRRRNQDGDDCQFGGADRPASCGEDDTDDEQHHEDAAEEWAPPHGGLSAAAVADLIRCAVAHAPWVSPWTCRHDRSLAEDVA